MSRHVSWSCNSECRVPVCQSNVATCPFFPTTARCLPFRVYLARYGPPSNVHSFLPLAASWPDALATSSWPTLHVLSISSSTWIPPASSCNSSSESFTRAFAFVACALSLLSFCRSFGFWIWLYDFVPSGGGELVRRDLGRDVWGTTEWSVRSSGPDDFGFVWDEPLSSLRRLLTGLKASALAIRLSMVRVYKFYNVLLCEWTWKSSTSREARSDGDPILEGVYVADELLTQQHISRLGSGLVPCHQLTFQLPVLTASYATTSTKMRSLSSIRSQVSVLIRRIQLQYWLRLSLVFAAAKTWWGMIKIDCSILHHQTSSI